MNNPGHKYTVITIDLSKPPPGYGGDSYEYKKYDSNVKPQTPDSKGGKDSTALTSYPYTSNEIMNNTSGKSANARTTSTPPGSNYGGLQYNHDLYTQYIAQPPPPPPQPLSLYQPNTEMQPGQQFYIYPGIYNSYPLPPAPIGAKQYVNQQQGNYQQQYQREYNSGFYNRGGFNNLNNRKRKLPQEAHDTLKKIAKKKKKPLSQNIPIRKDWSVEEAKRALEVEQEFNKRHKSMSLIIKFPDLELNRDIVSKFHPKIDSVHFQLPSNPRFCFVTLKDNANVDEVVKELNKIKFGYGYLTVEPKRDKEDQTIGPEDIDPLTLYVGNLSQEVTVDDVVKAYPKNKRIDIGFAKKMKYTRYAFVCFRTVNDAIEAFQNTHATEMYSKSLIVRFRRLHGTVGLPGEPKPQNYQKKNNESTGIPENDFWKEQEHHVALHQFKQEIDGSYLSDEYNENDLSNLFDTGTNKTMSDNMYDSDSSTSFVFSDKGTNKPHICEDENVPRNDIKVKEEPPDEGSEDVVVQHHTPANKQSHVPLIEVKKENDLVSPKTSVKEESEWAEPDKKYDTFQIQKESDDDSDIEASLLKLL